MRLPHGEGVISSVEKYSRPGILRCRLGRRLAESQRHCAVTVHRTAQNNGWEMGEVPRNVSPPGSVEGRGSEILPRD